MSKLKWWKTACAVCVLSAAAAIALPAQTFTTLHIFEYTDGAYPQAALVQATNGNLYGTTRYGGANDTCGEPFEGCGTVFEISPSGTVTTLHSFDYTDGYNPFAGLVLGTDGNLYGTTYYGGAEDYYGTVFKITPSGILTTLHSFGDGADGAFPYAGLVQATNGDFYGTTDGGGANGFGTVFKVTSGGSLTTLYSFCSQIHCTDGSGALAALIQDTNGTLYGTTAEGGANGYGTVFKITPNDAHHHAQNGKRIVFTGRDQSSKHVDFLPRSDAGYSARCAGSR